MLVLPEYQLQGYNSMRIGHAMRSEVLPDGFTFNPHKDSSKSENFREGCRIAVFEPESVKNIYANTDIDLEEVKA